MKKFVLFGILVLLVAAQVQAAQVQAKPCLQVTDLGVLPGGDTAVGLAINERQQVVGWADSPTNNQIGFAWSKKGGMKELEGTVFGTAINNSGTIGGVYFWHGNGGVYQSGFLIQKGRFIDLTERLRVPNGRITYVQGINNSGQICGDLCLGQCDWTSFVTDKDARVARILPLSGCSDINEDGAVIGNTHTRLPMLIRGDELQVLLPLPNVYYEFLLPSAINDQGLIVGWYQDEYYEIYQKTGLVWEDTPLGYRVSQLPLLAGYDHSEPNGVNNRGQIVGTAIHEMPTGPRSSRLYLTPVMWEKKRGRWTVVDLSKQVPEDPNILLLEGKSINNSRDIVVTGWNKSLRQMRTFLLR